MEVSKSVIIEMLRAGGKLERAEFVDRQLPELVDVHRNAGLLRMLGIDPAALVDAQATESV